MKVKGIDLIAKYNRAKSVVARASNRLGEIGGMVRSQGYDILIDGFSCCDFYEKGTYLRYYANNIDSPWHLAPCIKIGENTLDIAAIDAEAEYEIEEQLSVAEQFEKGLLNCNRFGVYKSSDLGSSCVGIFSTFEEADKYARNLCQAYIDSRFTDRDCTRYYMHSVQNDAQLAAERGELRYYPWYDYKGHTSFISVSPSK